MTKANRQKQPANERASGTGQAKATVPPAEMSGKGFASVRKAADASNEAAQAVAFDLPEDASEADDAPKQRSFSKSTSVNPHPRTIIVQETLLRAIPVADRRRLEPGGGPPMVLIVKVPSVSWIDPVKRFVRGLNVECMIVARDGTSKFDHQPTKGNVEVVEALVKFGQSVVGVAVDPSAVLPAALVRNADRTIVVRPPDAAIVATALQRCLPGRRPGAIDETAIARLGLDDLTAAMRKGSTRQEALRRIEAASAREVASSNTEGAPALATAVEFGDARLWGLDLVRDIADLRAGRISWSQCLKGAVLHSESGLGKSTVVASIARAAGIPLLRYSIADYFGNDSHLGTVLVRQREMFERAAANAPCLLFIDEIDALPSRDQLGKDTHGSSWWMPIVNDFLLRLDSAVAGQREGVVVVGATNAIGRVDPAILRPGRLERAIEIRRPDFAGAVNIMRFHLGKDLRTKDISDIARLVEGSTAAELMDLVRKARRAARAGNRPLRIDDLREVALGGVGGDAKPEFRMRSAVHEAAHAVASIVEKSGKLVFAMLSDTGSSGGKTRIEYNEELPTLDWFERRCVMLLAAGIAEQQILGQRSAGSAGSDFADLTLVSHFLSVARASLGLTGSLFSRCAPDDALQTVRADPDLRGEVEDHLRELENRAAELVRRHRNAIVKVAAALVERRHLSGDEITAIFQGASANAVRCEAAPVVVETSRDDRTSPS